MPLPELCSHKRIVLSSWNRLICQQYDVLVLLRVVVSFPCAACVQLGAHGGAGNAARVAGETRSSALIALDRNQCGDLLVHRRLSQCK